MATRARTPKKAPRKAPRKALKNAPRASTPTRRHRAPAGAAPRPQAPGGIARWPELKLDIVRRYGAAYSTVSSRQPGLTHYYIEGFAGPGVHVPKASGFSAGSPLNALLVTPPFRHHYLVDLDGERAPALRRAAAGRDDVTVFQGDANRALLEDVLPRVRQDDYRRALCVLDPCRPHLDWRVLEMAGRLRTIDLFVTLPAGDVHGWLPDALDGAAPQAFTRRLREEAAFANVLEPLPLRNDHGTVVAHLFFASKSDTANHVVADIFARHRDGATR